MMVVLGALAAFMAVLAPAIGNASELAKYALQGKQMEFGVNKIISALDGAAGLGRGQLRMEIELAAPLEIRSQGASAVFEYEIGGRQFRIESAWRGPPFDIALPSGKTGLIIREDGLEAEKSAKKS
ncbi:MAG: hypothetical protein ABH863_01345 [Candidatus Micrarchaeota archaeon]